MKEKTFYSISTYLLSRQFDRWRWDKKLPTRCRNALMEKVNLLFTSNFPENNNSSMLNILRTS